MNFWILAENFQFDVFASSIYWVRFRILIKQKEVCDTSLDHITRSYLGSHYWIFSGSSFGQVVGHSVTKNFHVSFDVDLVKDNNKNDDKSLIQVENILHHTHLMSKSSIASNNSLNCILFFSGCPFEVTHPLVSHM